MSRQSGVNSLFRTNQPKVISQSVDDEVVIINLRTGSYYSLTGTAAAIWNAIEHGQSTPQMVEMLTSHFTNCDPRLEELVSGFLNELQVESLVVPVEGAESPMAGNFANGTIKKGERFVRPELKKFTDMQELLLLDPIHEVDATGWPLSKSTSDHGAGN